jgi:mono/diheme cytochrome c family protein
MVLSAAVLLLLSSSVAMAQQPKKNIKNTPLAMTSPASGKEMFNSYCAACHGKSGKGDGPAATEFKIPPANLTLLSRAHDGRFPETYVSQVIENGPRDAKAHGSKDMPVWGTLFGSLGDQASIKQRVYNLNKYIQSLQEK